MFADECDREAIHPAESVEVYGLFRSKQKKTIAVRKFVLVIARNAAASGFRTGGPLMTVALETATSSPRLNQACRAAYQQLQAAFVEKLRRCGYSTRRAGELAIYINAAIEGGIILSRTAHSAEPLRRIARELGRQLKTEAALAPAPKPRRRAAKSM